MRNKEELYDFRAFGKAIKKAREDRRLTRERAAALIPIEPRYLTNIENKGQHPSLHVFHKLVTLYELSVDQYFYPDKKPGVSTIRRQLDTVLDEFSDTDLIIIEATAKGVMQAKNEGKT